MVRLLLADVTLIRGWRITVQVRFNGDASMTLQPPKALTAWKLRTTRAEIVSDVDRLTNEYADKQIAYSGRRE